MTHIKKTAIENFMGPIAEDQLDIKVSLFVVSSKSTRLKKIDLDNLSPAERTAKLKKWGQQNRFVAVIEIGDRIFAHAASNHIEQLNKVENLTLNGKKITIQALTDEQSKKLSAVGEAFAEHVLNDEIEESGKPTVQEEENAKKQAPKVLPRQFLAQKNLISDQVHTTHFLLNQMIKCDLGKIILRCLKKFSEDQREEKQRKEADDKKKEIVMGEIKKEILHTEIRHMDIQHHEEGIQIIRDDVKRKSGG